VAAQVVAMTVATVAVADKPTPMWLHIIAVTMVVMVVISVTIGRGIGRIDHEMLVEVVVE
jgi:hypothetical protein